MNNELNPPTGFEVMADFNQLYSAYLESRKGKRWKCAVVRFEVNVLENIMFLHFMLTKHKYRPSPYNYFLVPLGLELNHKTAVFPLSQGIDFLGFRTYMTDSGKVVRKLRRESKNRIRRKLKKFRHLLDEGRITFETVVQSYSSWIGHAAHGNSYHLIRNTDELFYDLFRKEMGEYHVKTTVDASRRRDREVGQHEV